MKKLISLMLLGLVICSASAQGNYQPRRFSFLNGDVFGDPQGPMNPIQNTNATKLKGITVTNAASAPLGGYTNINSWTYGSIVQTTNMLLVTWTNANNVWVIPTNNTPGTLSGVLFTTNDYTPLTVDVPLWVDREGRTPFMMTTNAAVNDSIFVNSAISPVVLSARISGDTSAGSTLNLIFVGIPDGRNEPSSATVGSIPSFQWGITAAAGTTVVATNFPTWKFAGCRAVRLRSATLTTTTAANIGVTIQDLSLNGFPP